MSEHNHDCECGCGCGCGHEEEEVTVTLTLDDGSEMECAVLTIFPAGENEYIALLPLEPEEDDEEGEVYLYRYKETADGEPELENIEDDEEFERASEAFDEWLDTQEFEELDLDSLE